jgi:hypothetical protein
MPMRSLCAVLLALSARSVPAAEPAPPAPRYYVLIFGSDAGELKKGKTHTWATFVKATPAADGKPALESFTISWLPADGTVNAILPLKRECGKNYTLEETLAFACKNKETVALWGPFEVAACAWDSAVAQKARLEGGGVTYRAVDAFRRRPDRSHCVHAVIDIDPKLTGTALPPLQVGIKGTTKTMDLLTGGSLVPDRCKTHDWLIAALGLECHRLCRMK